MKWGINHEYSYSICWYLSPYGKVVFVELKGIRTASVDIYPGKDKRWLSAGFGIRTASVDIYPGKDKRWLSAGFGIRTASVDIYLGFIEKANVILEYSYSICWYLSPLK